MLFVGNLKVIVSAGLCCAFVEDLSIVVRSKSILLVLQLEVIHLHIHICIAVHGSATQHCHFKHLTDSAGSLRVACSSSAKALEFIQNLGYLLPGAKAAGTVSS